MGPKKGADKGAPGKKAPAVYAQREFDYTIYQRQAQVLPALGDIGPLTVPLSGKINHLQHVYTEWPIEPEAWVEPAVPVDDRHVVYPESISMQTNEIKPLRTVMGYVIPEPPPVDPKAKKPDPKKTAVVVVDNSVEKLVDETGQPLPRVYCGEDTMLKQYYQTFEFRKTWSLEQRERKKYMDHLQQSIGQVGRALVGNSLQISEGGSEGNNSVVESSTTLENSLPLFASEELKQQHLLALQQQYDAALAERDVLKEEPQGDDCDPLMCAAFRLISEFAVRSSSIVEETNPADSDPHDGAVVVPGTAPLSSSATAGAAGGLNNENLPLLNSSDDDHLLWNAIYPQVLNGRPYFNTTGQYTVRLFVGGRWTKVCINDNVPCDEQGQPLLASSPYPSANRKEMWPTLLAKAVYVIYASCGYHHLQPSTEMALTTQHPTTDVAGGEGNMFMMGNRPPLSSMQTMIDKLQSNPHNASAFLGFVLHTLTGWLPGTPRSLPLTLNHDLLRGRGLLQEMLFGGAPQVALGDVPTDHVPVIPEGCGGISAADLALLKTKRQFKEEYSRRFAIRAKILSEISTREEQARAINQGLSEPSSEGFFLCLQGSNSSEDNGSGGGSGSDGGSGGGDGSSTGGVRVVPVLGLCFPQGTDLASIIHGTGTSEADYATVMGVKALVHFRTLPPGSPLSNSTIQPPALTAGVTPGTNATTTTTTTTTTTASTASAAAITRQAPSSSVTNPPEGAIDETTLSPDVLALLNGLNDPLPACTTITSVWMTLGDIIHQQGVLLGVDTRRRMKHRASLEWRWGTKVPIDTHAAPPDHDKKGKKDASNKPSLKSGGGSVDERSLPQPAFCCDLGPPPPTLLSLDTASFFLHQHHHGEMGEVALPSVAVEEGNEGQMAIQAQREALEAVVGGSTQGNNNGNSSSSGSAPSGIHPYLTLSVSVQIDVVLPASEHGSLGSSQQDSLTHSPRAHGHGVGETAAPIMSTAARADLIAQQAAASETKASEPPPAPVHQYLPSDCVVVLQELRFDGKEPLVMRVELSALALVPLTRTTFHIPVDRILADGLDRPHGRLLFWVRIFTKASMQLIVDCAAPILLGDAEKIWMNKASGLTNEMGTPAPSHSSEKHENTGQGQDQDGQGGYVLVREGQATATRGHTEQLLFRVPLSMSSSSSSSTSSSSSATAVEVDPTTTPTSTPLAVFLHVNDRDVARSVSLLSVGASQDGRSLPRIDGNFLIVEIPPAPASSTGGTVQPPTNVATTTATPAGVPSPVHTLIARCFPLPTSLPLHPLPSPLPHITNGIEGGGVVSNNVSLSSGDDDDGSLAHGLGLPSFRWKLVVLSHRPFDEPFLPPPTTPTMPQNSPLQRYRGAYKDNNTLTIFRDILSVDKTSFPLALRIAMAPLPLPAVTPASSSSSSHHNNDDIHDHYNYQKSHQPPLNISEELMFVVRLYRKDDRQLVYETKARGVAQLYNLPLADFLPLPGSIISDPIPAATAPGGKAAAAPAGKGKAPAAAKGAAAVKVVEAQDLIVECCIDEEAMIVPEAWRSRVPLQFSPLPDTPSHDASTISAPLGGGSSLSDGVSKDSQLTPEAQAAALKEHRTSWLLPSLRPDAMQSRFIWTMDILAGTVTQMAHDTYDLERRLKVKNGWEETTPGRGARASAAVTYALVKRAILNNDLTALQLLGGSSGEPLTAETLALAPVGKNATSRPGSPLEPSTARTSTTDQLIDLLTEALEKEDRIPFAEREPKLLTVPKYQEHIEYVGQGLASLVTPEQLATQQEVRSSHRDAAETHAKRLSEMMASLCDMQRTTAKERMAQLNLQAALQAHALHDKWQSREAYRLATEARSAEAKSRAESSAAASEMASFKSAKSGAPAKK